MAMCADVRESDKLDRAVGAVVNTEDKEHRKEKERSGM